MASKLLSTAIVVYHEPQLLQDRVNLYTNAMHGKNHEAAKNYFGLPAT
jgi:hypothetical protein